MDTGGCLCSSQEQQDPGGRTALATADNFFFFFSSSPIYKYRLVSCGLHVITYYMWRGLRWRRVTPLHLNSAQRGGRRHGAGNPLVVSYVSN
jgi:hypothetical protein